MPRSCICALFGIQYQKAAFLAVPPSSGAFSSRTTSSPSQRANSAAGRPPPPPPTTTTSASTSNGASAGTGADEARAGTGVSLTGWSLSRGCGDGPILSDGPGRCPPAPPAWGRIGTKMGRPPDVWARRPVQDRGGEQAIREAHRMTAVDQQPVLDPAKLEQFVFRAVEEVGATLNAALVVMGDRLGLYRAMAGAGALTPTEIAERTGTAERYLREWLNAQAAGGYVAYHPDS